eukprot:322941-Alexandrium_andersonii.AAC.1
MASSSKAAAAVKKDMDAELKEMTFEMLQSRYIAAKQRVKEFDRAATRAGTSPGTVKLVTLRCPT